MSEHVRIGGTEPTEAVSASDRGRTFEEFFHGEKADLFATLCIVTRDRHEAEELTQDAFVRVLERWDRVGSMDDPRGYLYRTAMNAFRSRYRRAIRRTKRIAGTVQPDDGIAEIEARDSVIRAMAALSERQRAAVVLTDLLDLPSREAARILGIRPSTVRMHVSRAHAVLKGTMPHD
jgi:RNA polymerase sigma-70 factor, ECF subfamily